MPACARQSAVAGFPLLSRPAVLFRRRPAHRRVEKESARKPRMPAIWRVCGPGGSGAKHRPWHAVSGRRAAPRVRVRHRPAREAGGEHRPVASNPAGSQPGRYGGAERGSPARRRRRRGLAERALRPLDEVRCGVRGVLPQELGRAQAALGLLALRPSAGALARCARFHPLGQGASFGCNLSRGPVCRGLQARRRSGGTDRGKGTDLEGVPGRHVEPAREIRVRRILGEPARRPRSLLHGRHSAPCPPR